MHIWSHFDCHAMRLVRTSMAVNVPEVLPPGGVTNALPRRSVPCSILSGLAVQTCGWWMPQMYIRFVCGLYEAGDHSVPPLAPGQISTGSSRNGVKMPAVG